MSYRASTFPYKLRYQHIIVALLIVLVAFGLRVTAIYQRAAFDPSFVPMLGTDHYGYLESAKGVLDGTFPTTPFFFHPGPSYVFAGIYSLLGSTNFVLLTIVIALIDALTCGMLIGAGWLLSKRAWGGYLAGMIYAVYPVAIFYATTPLITPLAAFFISGLIFFTLWQRNTIKVWRTIVLGIFAGLLAIHRLNLAPLVGLYGLWLLMMPINWQKRISHGIIFAALIVAIIAPFTYSNYQLSGGKFIPIATTGSSELYMGNNRDSAGLYSTTFAYQQVDMAYEDAIWRDARVAPEHFWGLFAYKFALFWSDVEIGNNVDFASSSDYADMIDFVPLRFSTLAILGIIGLSALWYHQRETAIILGLMIAWMCFGFVLVFAFGRIRFPAVIPLTLLSSFGLVALVDSIRFGFDAKQVGKRHIVTLIGLITLYSFIHWALSPEPKLPPERLYNDLPSDAVQLDIQFGEVTFVGWRLLDDEWQHLENGWVPFYESYAVELFWSIPEPVTTSYNFFLAYIDDNQRYDAVDTPIGTVSFPYYTTDEWRANRILGEIVTLRLDDDVPQARSGQIRLGVWYWDEDGLIVNVPTSTGDNNILIQHIAVFDAVVPDMPQLPSSEITFGDMIMLRGYDLPTSGTVNETISIPFYWEAITNITDDYRLFIHVIDDTGDIVTQGDAPPLATLLTSNWKIGYPLLSENAVTLPETTGTYAIYIGLYNLNGRLAVDAPNNSVLIGAIEVTE